MGNKQSGAKSVEYQYEFTAPPQDDGGPPPTFDTITFPKGFTGLSEVFVNIESLGQDDLNPVFDNVCVTIHG